MKVIGIKNVSYNRKADNRLVEGVEIHYTYESKHVTGLGCDRAFISKSVIDDNMGAVPMIGSEIDLLYNRFGKVSGFVEK